MGEGPSKRPRVGLSSERTERRQMEVGDPQVGSRVVEALWALNARLGEIQAKLVAGWEAALESAQLLHQSVIYNLRQIDMSLAVQRDRSWEEGELEVKGWGRLRSRRSRQKSRWSEWSKWGGTCKKMNISKIKEIYWF